MNDELNFWSGAGGDAYMRRNCITSAEIARRSKSLKRILDPYLAGINSILEIGCGPGANLYALRDITSSQLFAVEPNAQARANLEREFKVFDGHAGAICAADNAFAMTLSAGCLIHIHPDRLVDCMREITRVSRRYVLAIEYFAPQCEPVVYYGTERIWRNDFGRLYRDECGLRPVSHGFFWKEADEGYDNCVFWLMEKP